MSARCASVCVCGRDSVYSAVSNVQLFQIQITPSLASLTCTFRGLRPAPIPVQSWHPPCALTPPRSAGPASKQPQRNRLERSLIAPNANGLEPATLAKDVLTPNHRVMHCNQTIKTYPRPWILSLFHLGKLNLMNVDIYQLMTSHSRPSPRSPVIS